MTGNKQNIFQLSGILNLRGDLVLSCFLPVTPKFPKGVFKMPIVIRSSKLYCENKYKNSRKIAADYILYTNELIFIPAPTDAKTRVSPLFIL